MKCIAVKLLDINEMVSPQERSQIALPSPQARSSQDPLNRYLARVALAVLPRGGGDGDAIRMGILHIMRENGIREGHRPVCSPTSSPPSSPLVLRSLHPPIHTVSLSCA